MVRKRKQSCQNTRKLRNRSLKVVTPFTSKQLKISAKPKKRSTSVKSVVEKASQHKMNSSKQKAVKWSGYPRVHGAAETIRHRRESVECYRKTRSATQLADNQTDSSAIPHSAHHAASSNFKTIERENKLLPKIKNTEDSCCSHECQLRPRSCSDLDNTEEVCVIKKCELWLHDRVVKPMAVEDMHEVKDQVVQLDDSDADEYELNKGHFVTETLSSVLKAPIPCCNINVRVTGYTPILKNPSYLVRGHCPHFSCNKTHEIIDWSKSGPLNFGKLLRPYCTSCSNDRIKRYLDLYFYLELTVVDNSHKNATIIVQRENAMRFFGMSVHKFLIHQDCRSHIVKLLEALVQKCSPKSDSTGMFINLYVVPVASEAVKNMQFHLFGDNLPLSKLVQKTC